MRDVNITITVDITTLKLLEENAYLMTEISAKKDILPHVIDEKRALQFALTDQNTKLHVEYNKLKGAML